jgi:hypothetical protein
VVSEPSSGWARSARAIAVVAGLVSLVVGLWAFFAPANFYDQVAAFPPYNRHFIHDIGAFEIGFGVLLLVAAAYGDALFVALAGFGVGATFHFAAHVMDHRLGGHTAFDLTGLGLLAAVSLAGAAARFATLRRSEQA